MALKFLYTSDRLKFSFHSWAAEMECGVFWEDKTNTKRFVRAELEEKRTSRQWLCLLDSSWVHHPTNTG